MKISPLPPKAYDATNLNTKENKQRIRSNELHSCEDEDKTKRKRVIRKIFSTPLPFLCSVFIGRTGPFSKGKDDILLESEAYKCSTSNTRTSEELRSTTGE